MSRMAQVQSSSGAPYRGLRCLRQAPMLAEKSEHSVAPNPGIPFGSRFFGAVRMATFLHSQVERIREA
jgi:hypothetical protein